MNFLPATNEQRSRLLLFPFKAYVLAAYFFALIWKAVSGRNTDLSDVGSFVLFGYVVCFVVLLAVATLEAFTRRRRDALFSIGFAALAFVFAYLLIPVFFVQ